MIVLEDCVKLQEVELRVYYADGTSREFNFADLKRALKQVERDFAERAISYLRIIPVYSKEVNQ